MVKERINWVYMMDGNKKIEPSGYFKKLYRELNDLEPKLEQAIIDFEFVFRYPIDNERDIEISCISKKKQKANLYLWDHTEGYQIIDRKMGVPHDEILIEIADILGNNE